MKCCTWLKAGVAVTVVFACFATAQADDLHPPPWRGDPLGVETHWDFTNPNWSATMELMPNEQYEYGLPGYQIYSQFYTHIDFDYGPNWIWGPEGATANNSTDTGASFAANMQNWIDQEPIKYLRIQISYIGMQPDITDELTGIIPQAGAPNLEFPGMFMDGYEEPGYFYEDWYIEPNPYWEHIPIWVPNGTTITQVDIDTVSFPEPTTLTLLVLGGLALRRSSRSS